MRNCSQVVLQIQHVHGMPAHGHYGSGHIVGLTLRSSHRCCTHEGLVLREARNSANLSDAKCRNAASDLTATQHRYTSLQRQPRGQKERYDLACQTCLRCKAHQ